MRQIRLQLELHPKPHCREPPNIPQLRLRAQTFMEMEGQRMGGKG